ncbi:MAG: hypothetical protein V8R75_16065 [Oscillospiraceae bacterium]
MIPADVRNPYQGAYRAVAASLAKLAAAGADYRKAYLTLQEFFEAPGRAPSLGQALGALLGALDAQLDYGAAAIGGKDSMSGTFNDLDVPPTWSPLPSPPSVQARCCSGVQGGGPSGLCLRRRQSGTSEIRLEVLFMTCAVRAG